MMSSWLMKWLILQYILVFLFCLYERQWPRALYWLGAAILNVAILWGMK